MKRTTLFWLVVASLSAALVSAACGSSNTTTGSITSVVGSGKVVSESRTVSGFTEVETAYSANVTITQGDHESLTIEAEDNLLPLLTSEVRNNRLVLDTKPNVSISPTVPINVTVTIKSLTALATTGSGAITASNVATDRLESTILGSGDITVSGSADNQTVAIFGSGSFQGGELDGKTAAINVNGSGDAFVNVSDTLSAAISGSGSVTYSGSPTITDQTITGSGQILQR